MDTVGANIYQQYLERYRKNASRIDHPVLEGEIKRCQREAVLTPARRMPDDVDIGPHTVNYIEGSLSYVLIAFNRCFHSHINLKDPTLPKPYFR